MRLLRRGFNVILFIWLIVLVLRSFVHVKRIYIEFTKTPLPYFENVKACSDGWDKNDFAKRTYYNYLSLGEKCEK